MPYSTRWEEPEVSKCDGCIPFFIPGYAEQITETGKKILKELQKEIDWSRPDIILIFECVECQKEFDCNTTSFKILCDKSKEAGWKMVWHDQGYSTTCKTCTDKECYK